jgi:hypothetical protein
MIWRSNEVLLLRPRRPLPYPNANMSSASPSDALPFAIELADGTMCATQEGGTHNSIGALTIFASCGNGSALAGEIDRSTPLDGVCGA